MNAEEGSVYQKLLEGNMQDDISFVKIKDGLRMVLEKSNYAYYADKQLILGAFADYHCKVLLPQKQLRSHYFTIYYRSGVPGPPMVPWKSSP